MLNKSGLHLNENDTKLLVKGFCFNMCKWYDTICLDRPTATIEDIVKKKNTDRPINNLLQELK